MLPGAPDLDNPPFWRVFDGSGTVDCPLVIAIRKALVCQFLEVLKYIWHDHLPSAKKFDVRAVKIDRLAHGHVAIDGKDKIRRRGQVLKAI